MLFIVAMAMEGGEIGWFLIGMIAIDVIDFNQIALSKGQFTPAACSLLLLEQLRKLSPQ